MTTTTLVTIYCDACGLPASELAADRRLDFCPQHKGRRTA